MTAQYLHDQGDGITYITDWYLDGNFSDNGSSSVEVPLCDLLLFPFKELDRDLV